MLEITYFKSSKYFFVSASIRFIALLIAALILVLSDFKGKASIVANEAT